MIIYPEPTQGVLYGSRVYDLGFWLGGRERSQSCMSFLGMNKGQDLLQLYWVGPWDV